MRSSAISFSPSVAPLWQTLLQQAVRDPAELLRLLELPAELLNTQVDPAPPGFGLRVPPPYLARMRKGDPADPLLRQVLPLLEEYRAVPGFSTDPVGDSAARPCPGLLHKYQGRALLLLTGACAVHCRYCFRRHYPYSDLGPDWQAQTLDYLRADPSIQEIILSGGDPLSLSDTRLRTWLDALAELPQLRRLRLHSRLPVVLPQRVTPELLELLGQPRWHSVLVIHVNHANEVDAEVARALAELSRAGVWLFNQTVLLRGVNDSVAALVDLSEALAACRVVPYYLHQLDRVQGAAHFAVSDAEALQLLDGLRERLPGYLVPKLVREVAGLPYKQALTDLQHDYRGDYK